ncbi:hypothetical protein [Oenococcus oeni]|uniref:hypothetical protein n=1 Tax=Oenococcus oeni TaxID=1247 RepID=UPI0010B23DDC|nr:hypothetical protein [Oenococcus oeni]SYW09205.1 conserved membrane hypothetical protein [Oenococcus oeni]
MIFLTVILFISSNSFIFLFHKDHQNFGIVFRTSLFVVFLYSWASIRLLASKRFAVSFMDFVNIVYAVGFISNIALAATKISGINVWIVVGMSLIGFIINILISKSARKFKSDMYFSSTITAKK